MIRKDGRACSAHRPVTITRNFIKPAEGSVLIEMGETKVICTASLEEKVPPFLRDKGTGWITAEYSMLPRSTHQRSPRESSRGKIGGRTHEIQRLIGRSLRSVADLEALGERTVWIDCDVIQADGGTRTASITGSFLALHDAIMFAKNKSLIKKQVLTDYLAAISVGKVGNMLMTDLCYEEDSMAQVDMNLVMTGEGRFVEIQGTAEHMTFTSEELSEFLDLGRKAIENLVTIQKNLIGSL
ncbi:MAG: ribonuclease PH [Nitrospiraceae bacterium]|nr:ribonuclease PH [Nitrospiraceae bacterium]